MVATLVAKILISITLMTGFHNPGKPGAVKINSLIRYGDLSFSTSRIIKTSPGLFNLLNYELIGPYYGSINGFSEGVVLPEKTKIRLFGNSPALGKIIYVDSHQLKIVGVIRDVPEKSCLDCDVIILSNKTEVHVETLKHMRSSILL